MSKYDNQPDDKDCSKPEADKCSQRDHAEPYGGNDITGIVMKVRVKIPREADECELQQNEPQTTSDEKKGGVLEALSLNDEISRRTRKQDKGRCAEMGNEASGK